MSIRDKLIKILGSENFSDNPKVLESYSKDFSIVPAGMPNYMVKPGDTAQVAKVVQLANKELIPVIPVSSAVHYNGASIPKQGGIMVDLTRMNKILEIDELNRRVRIEPGVTWQQLVTQLDKKGLRITMPLLPHPLRSVVTDYLEREVITNTVYDYGEPTQSLEVVWPNGEVFRTGSASVNGYPDSPSKGANPSGPGLDFYRFLQGAQGTMGIVTWASFKIQVQPKIDKILFAPINDLDYVTEFLYRILRIRIGQECLLLNNVDLAAILAEDWPSDFEKFRAILPPWSLILVISGLQHLPEEKIKYEEDALRGILKSEFTEINLTDSLPGLKGLNKKMMPMLRRPWPKAATYWKNSYKGACQSLFFMTRPNLVSTFVNTMNAVAVAYGYPLDDIGGYIQPIEHNRACYMQFDLFYDPASEAEIMRLENFYHKAAEVLQHEGAFFSRPYGKLADMVYQKADS
jgi:hypothetical protein